MCYFAPRSVGGLETQSETALLSDSPPLTLLHTTRKITTHPLSLRSSQPALLKLSLSTVSGLARQPITASPGHHTRKRCRKSWPLPSQPASLPGVKVPDILLITKTLEFARAHSTDYTYNHV
jgi:hypothetical protein